MTYNLLFLRNFSNYFNRTVKRLETVDEYVKAVGDDGYAAFDHINFVPADGVATTQVINWALSSQYELIGWQPDYMLAIVNGSIESRWFVVESKRLRNGQYQFSLKRDSVADFLQQVGNAKAYVVRGMLSTDNPLIYNPEGISFNQIKKRELIIADKSAVYGKVVLPYPLPQPYYRIPNKYVVGYFGRDNFDKATEISVPVNSSSTAAYETIKTPISDWYPQYLNKVQYITPSGTDVRLIVSAKSGGRSGSFDYFCVSPYTSSTRDGSEQSVPGVLLDGLNDTSLTTDSRGPGWTGYDLGLFGGSGKGDGYAVARTILRQAVSQEVVLDEATNEHKITLVGLTDINSILAYDNKIIQDSTGAKYRIRAQLGGAKWSLYSLPSSGKVSDYVQNKKIFSNTFPDTKAGTFSWDTWDIFSVKTFNDSTLGAALNLQPFELTAERIYDTYMVTIPASSSRKHCIDSAFDIFVIPVSHDEELEGKLPVAVSIGQEILAKTNGVKDLQLLPYSPIQDKWSNGVMRNPDAEIASTKEPHYLDLFFAGNSQASFSGLPITVNEPIEPVMLVAPQDPVELKVSSETNVFRLVAPNYSSVFEFSVYKNGGFVSCDIDCAFKPYQPYIHVAPHFGGLYGEDFNDVRGLTLTGNFSLDQYTDAWATYELNNKNYQLTFDRQIDTLELNQSLQRTEQIAGSISGAVQATANGAIAGSLLGGPIGGAIGGAVSGITSAAAGVVDWVNLAMSQSDQLNASRAYFSNSIGNIKAIPHTVSKVSAYNPNNKVWPILEEYSSTDTEKDLFRSLIEARSMTVGAIMDIGPFIHSSGDRKWLQCQPIRLEGLSEDSHIANDIYQELAKGVYI